MDGQTKTKPSGLKEWKPEQGAGYYVVGADGHIEAHVWQGHEHDLQTWSFGNTFHRYLYNACRNAISSGSLCQSVSLVSSASEGTSQRAKALAFISRSTSA